MASNTESTSIEIDSSETPITTTRMAGQTAIGAKLVKKLETLGISTKTDNGATESDTRQNVAKTARKNPISFPKKKRKSFSILFSRKSFTNVA